MSQEEKEDTVKQYWEKLDKDSMEMSWGDGNHYLIINDDPGIIEVMNEKKLLHTLAESIVCTERDQGGWDLRKGAGENDTEKENTTDLREIMEWLNSEHPGGRREPSPFFISDHNAHYNWIRRITSDE